MVLTQPYLLFLAFEAFLFLLACLGDAYVTNSLVSRYGPMVEANPRVRRMYEEGGLWQTWVPILGCLGLYPAFGLIGSLPMPGAPYIAVSMGFALFIFPGVNLVRGSLVFRRLRRIPPSRVS